MDGKLHKKIYRFILLLLLMAGVCIVPASANLKGGTWQELASSTGAINGTVPRADGALVPVYQGSTRLKTDQTNSVSYTAMPRDFSVNTDGRAMQAVNEQDTEGDIFPAFPLTWENDTPPAVGLVWADAATPDEPLVPQPTPNESFCAQNMAGRHLVVWPEIETSDDSPIPSLYLWTSTGVPDNNTVPLLQQKIAIDIAPAESSPISVSASNYDESLKAAKVKVGESITLTVTARKCDGTVFPNAHFTIRRGDAVNRKEVVNNSGPVHVGNTELTTTETLYRGVTDANGTATVVVTQADGPGVKTPLFVSSETFPELFTTTEVIFTVITSPDTTEANMYGHMLESATADLDGVTYTFTRPKLAAEAGDKNGTVEDTNETWAQFNWSGADSHCAILPAAEQLVALRNAHNTGVTYTGWPVANNAEYWSSTNDLYDYHYAVRMSTGQTVRESNSSEFLTSCVDKALPAAHPQITLSPSAPYKAKVGEAIDLVATVVDRDTKKPLPYRYMEIFIDPAKNRKGATNAEWDNLPVTISSDDMRASSPEHYTGVTDANGLVHLELKHDNGVGVETPIRIVMPDDDGGNVELPFSVIFTVVTSPDVDGANMYGHMQGVVDAGNLYKRPLLAVEASHKTGQQSENNEEWATFNSEEAATGQCGTGQVPNSGSLEHLYGEHPDNQMLTEHGWPTGSHPYIAAETDASQQAAHVNLADGGKGYGSQPNYLTCSANELVSMLEVYFNDDLTLRNGEAKVGEKVKMNVHSINALNGEALPFTDFTVTLSPGRQRDGLTTGFTDPSNGELIIDGNPYSVAQTPVYHGITDAQGNAEVIIEQPRGVGLLTPLTIAPKDSLLTTPINRSVKFTVATSPDTPNANMWGHMPDTLTVGDLTFERPKLAEEVSAKRVQEEANESWARVAHEDADGNPDAGGCAANRLPRIDQLEALYNANSGGKMHSVQGWPETIQYWSSTLTSATSWKNMTMDDGTEGVGGNSLTLYTSCLTTDNPTGTIITIEPVDASLWYDGEGVHAVKVKKGDTLQLKVTVKDISGNPLPSTPFVLSRGDGYTRQNEKHKASTGTSDPIVSPVVIDGESLNDTSTRIGKMTGEDGTVILNVTRPDTHGTRVALTAALYSDTNVSASIDTIFTVVTSPDVSVARMWGHMAETLQAKDGTVFHRPQLRDELSSTANTYTRTEDNEVWATFYGPESSKSNPANCKYHPSVEALDALYRTYPERTIKTEKGWPIDQSYWSGSNAVSGKYGTTEPKYYFYGVDLEDDSRRVLRTDSQNYVQFQTCVDTPMVKATRIELSSSSAEDSVTQAIKVKNSESIPFIIRTTDAAGNPISNTPVALTLDAGTAREASYTGWNHTFNLHIDGTSTFAGYLFPAGGTTLYDVTGDDGTLALTLYGTQAVGVKNVMTVSLYAAPTVTSSKSVLFTVQTSPDSDKANMWGHMQETFSASNGAQFKRPLLYGELTSTTDVSKYNNNNETWPLVKNIDRDGGRGACPTVQMATLADLQSLYEDHKDSGGITAALGLPTQRNWWAGDSRLSSSPTQLVVWPYMNLGNGDVSTTSSPSTFSNYQLCLTEPRQATLTLDSTAWDADKNAAVVKAGEALPLTVTVRDAAGQPVAGAVVRLTRGTSYSRNSTVYPPTPGKINPPSEDTSPGSYITLTPVSPSGSLYDFRSGSSQWYGLTGNDGTLQITLNQDSSPGLKTAITATLVDYNLAVTKDAIFTVATSPDTPYASYWGYMPDTVRINGKTLHRPLLRAEVASAPPGSWGIDGEIWAGVYIDYGKDKTSVQLSSLCGLDNVATLDDLKALQGVINELRWPTAAATGETADKSHDYVSQTMANGTDYYSFNETTGLVSTRTKLDFGFGVCLAQ